MKNAPHLIALLAAALSTLSPGVARADEDRRIHLAVHGALDAGAVGAALSRELGVEVELVDDVCDAPCVEVSVASSGDGRRAATIAFAPRAGAPRSRTVELGNDPAQWPTLVTLLASNVVRDEAQDLLAGLPGALPSAPRVSAPGNVPDVPEEPPAYVPPPPPVAPVAAPETPREHRFLGIGLVPGLSTDLTRIGTIQHRMSVDLLVGVSGGSTGLTMSGVADVETGPVAGVQLAGVATFASRVSGTQIAGVAAASGDVDGVQIAGVASVAGRVDGGQVAGVASVAYGGADTQAAGVASFARGRTGTQLAGVAAVSGGGTGTQVAGVTAMAGGRAGVQIAGVGTVARDANVQLSGVTNVAHGTTNVQIAGVVNVADRVRGLQLATLNVARDVEGVQVGVVNVGGSNDGFSFGLINIVPGGRSDLETSVDQDGTGAIMFRHGSRRWHNVYGVAGKLTDHGDSAAAKSDNDDVWMYGFGFGPSFQLEKNTMLDLEAISWQVNHGPHHRSDISILAQARASIAHRFGPVALVAGAMYNVYITDDRTSPLLLERRTSGSTMDTSVTVERWPSVFVGLRI